MDASCTRDLSRRGVYLGENTNIHREKTAAKLHNKERRRFAPGTFT